jgi:hypothetical protein
MFLRRFAVYTVIALCFAPMLASAAQARKSVSASASSPYSPADQAFLDAHEAARLGNRERLAQLAAQLAGHPLAAYVEYWQLVARLTSDEPGITTSVAEFQIRHANTFIADRLRLDWALALGSRGDRARRGGRIIWWIDDANFSATWRWRATPRFRASRRSFSRAAQLLAFTRDSAGEGCWR